MSKVPLEKERVFGSFCLPVFESQALPYFCRAMRALLWCGWVPLLWAQGLLQVSPPEHPFGRVRQGTLVRATFTIRNLGNEPVQIQDIKPSCNCSVLSWEHRALVPGDSLKVEATFNTAGKVGRQRKSFTVLSTAQNSPLLFYLIGEVEASTSYYEDD